MDLGKDHAGTALIKLLGIRFVDDGEVESIIAISGNQDTPMTDLAFEYRGGDDAHFRVDELLADESVPIFNSEDTVARFFYRITPEYRTIATSMILGALKDEDSLNLKPYLISEIVDCFLEQPDTTIEVSELENKQMDFSVAYPNPFRDNLVIRFNCHNTSKVELNIYSQEGRLVKSLINQVLPSGSHRVVWNAKNDNDNKVTNGLYYYRLKTGNKTETKKILLIN